MSRSIDLVADVGESFGSYRLGDDDALLAVLSSANVACGFHAGDPDVMDATVAVCARLDVAVGAHPGFADLRGFGRRPIQMTADEVRREVLYQLGALSAFTTAHGTTLSHVTPHGALGNLTMVDRAYAEGVVDAIVQFDPRLPLLTPAGVIVDVAEERGLTVGHLLLADRAYAPDGTLVGRRTPGSVLHDVDEILDRLLRCLETGTIAAIDGSELAIRADSVLVHGDTPGAVEIARRVRERLESSGIAIVPFREASAP